MGKHTCGGELDLECEACRLDAQQHPFPALTTAEVSSATVVMRGDEIARFAEMLRDAVQQGVVHLCVDTTGEEPIISVWAGEEYVSEVPVAGVVFE
jgi:hypothetical protein